MYPCWRVEKYGNFLENFLDIPINTEAWPRGLRQRIANPSYSKRYRRFESCRLRHNCKNKEKIMLEVFKEILFWGPFPTLMGFATLFVLGAVLSTCFTNPRTSPFVLVSIFEILTILYLRAF